VTAHDALDIRIGHHQLEISRRYEAASIANDVLIGLWFIVGSMLFFSDDTMTIATWLFLIGSVQMIIRPVIRLARLVHLGRIGPRQPDSDTNF